MVSKEKLKDLLLARDEAKRALKKLANEFASLGYPRYYRMADTCTGLLDEACGVVEKTIKD